eukprot:8517254-Ditylum_brightwellii.AAC.1
MVARPTLGHSLGSSANLTNTYRRAHLHTLRRAMSSWWKRPAPGRCPSFATPQRRSSRTSST